MTTSMTSILERLGIPHRSHGEHHHVSHGWLGLDCPQCSPRSGKCRLGYNLTSGYFTCWICGYLSGAYVLHEISGISYREAAKLLEDVPRVLSERKAPQGLKIPSGVGDLLPIHRKYLQSRGFDPEELSRVWGVRGIGLEAKLPWRLWIPVTQRRQVVSWTTRAVTQGVERRYINASPQEEAVSLKDVLYGADLARNAIVLVEGPADAWRIGPGAVATFGLVITSEQRVQITKFPKRYILFDNEEAAQQRAESLFALIKDYHGYTEILHIDSADPGEASDEEIVQIRKLLR